LNIELYGASRDRYKNILGQIKTGQAMLFLGAGSTRNCKKNDGKRGLTGQELANEIITKLNYNKKVGFEVDLMEACELYIGNKSNARQGLDKLIQERLSGLQPTIGHYIATSFPWKAVVTTNYNQVVENACDIASSLGFVRNPMKVVSIDADNCSDEKAKHIKLYKPHGCISIEEQSENQMILTSKDYFESEQKREKIYQDIKSLAKECSTIFIGYSMQDYTFRNMYYKLTEKLGSWMKESFNVGTMTQQNKHEKYGQWITRSMEKNFNTTLISDTFDTFMLRLLIENGKAHASLKEKIINDWQNIISEESGNKNYLNNVTLKKILGLSEI
jgi:hypothetical protein